MAKPGIVIKREYNDYEAAFNTLRERANIYKDLETFDKNWREVREGRNPQYQDLDTYIYSLTQAYNKGLTYDNLVKTKRADILDDSTINTILFAETLADQEKERERERVAYTVDGAPIKNQDGSYRMEKYMATDYDYLNELINQKIQYAVEQEYNTKAQELKNNRSFWEKVGSDLLYVPAKLTAGMSNAVANFLKFTGGTIEGIKGLFRGQNYADTKIEFYNEFDKYITFNKDFQEDIYEFERRFTDFRSFEGQENGWGKYIGGLAYTFGQMIPGMLIAQGMGLAGGAITKGAAAGSKALAVGKGIATTGKVGSTLFFYEAMAAENATEMYAQAAENSMSVSTGWLLASADVKAALQAGIEFGLAKILGGSRLDNLMFVRATTSGVAKAGQKSLVGAGLKAIGHDMLEEGLEEVFQDLSDFLIDKGFDKLFKTNFGEINKVTSQSLFDSFFMGAMASLIGNGVGIIRTSREVNPGKIKLDKDGKPVVDENATKKYYDLIKLRDAEMKRLGVDTVEDLVNNKKSKFTREDAAFIEDIDIRKDASGSNVIYAYEKMNKLASWAYGINMQSIIENFQYIQEACNEAIAKNDKVNIEKCKNALYTMYASTRLISSYFGEVGIERMQKADQILSYITNSFYNKELNILDITLNLQNVIYTIDRTAIEAETTKRTLTTLERAKELAEEQKENKPPVDKKVYENIERVLKDCPEVKSVEAVEHIDMPIKNKQGKVTVDINEIKNCDPVVIETTFTEQDLVDFLVDNITSHKIGLSQNELKLLYRLYSELKNKSYNVSPFYKVTKEDITDIVRGLCFEEDYINSVLYSNKMNAFVFDTIMLIQNAVNTFIPKSAYDALKKKTYTRIRDNIKAILTEFIINEGYINDINKYNIFTKEEFERIQNARYEKDFSRKLLDKRMNPDDWNRLQALLETKVGKETAARDITFLKKSTLIDDVTPVVSEVRKYLQELGYIIKTIEFLPNNTLANRMFNKYLRSNGLTLQTIFDKNSITQSDIDIANSANAFPFEFNNFEQLMAAYRELDNSGYYSEERVAALIHSVVFEESYNNKYEVDTIDVKNRSITVSQLLGETLNEVKTSNYGQLSSSFDAFSELRSERTNDFRSILQSDTFAIRSFDEEQRKKFIRLFIGDTTEFNLAVTTLQDIADNPALLSEEVKRNIIEVFGTINKDSVVAYMNSVIREFSTDSQGHSKYALGYDNTGRLLIYNQFSMSKLFAFNFEYLKNMMALASINGITFKLSDILKNIVSLKALRDIEVIISDYGAGENGSYSSEKNMIKINTHASTPDSMVYTLYHELQHAIQREYKMLNGFSPSVFVNQLIPVITDESGRTIDFKNKYKTELNAILNKIYEIYPDIAEAVNNNEFSENDVIRLLAYNIYINTGELFANAVGFNKNIPTAFLTPIPVYINEDGQACIEIMGIEINLGNKYIDTLSSPMYANISSTLKLTPEKLDKTLIKLKEKINLQGINVGNITDDDTDASIELLYESLGGDKQFKSRSEFYKMTFNVLYFEKRGASGKHYVVGTIINTDKSAIEKLLQNNEGLLYVGKITPFDIKYFAPNNINNVIIDKDIVFNSNDVGIVSVIDGNYSFSYHGQTVTENTYNLNAAKTIPVSNANSEAESNKIIADHPSTVASLERKYKAKNAKVVRAQYEYNRAENPTWIRRTRYYFDKPVTANRDWELTDYVRPEGYYKGKRVSNKQARTNPYLKLFADKRRSKDFQEFLSEAYSVREDLPEVLRTKIEDGTLTQWDIDEYVRSTSLDDMDEKIFELLNKTIYKNDNIKTLEYLRTLIDNSSLFYAVGVVFYVIGKKELLRSKNKDGVIEELRRVISEADPKLAARIERRQIKYNSDKYINISQKYLKLLYLRKYDGSIASAFQAANFAKMAIDKDWRVTGELSTVSTSTEATGNKGESFTPLSDIEDVESEINSDSLEMIFGDAEIAEMAKEVLELIYMEGKIMFLKGRMPNIKTQEEFEARWQNIEDNVTNWTDAQVKALFNKYSIKDDQIRKMYAAVMAQQVSGDDSYISDKKVIDRVNEAVDHMKRNSQNRVRSIKSFLNTIKRNVSEAEKKQFLRMNSDLFNDDFTIKDEVLYDVVDGELQLKDYDILLKIESRMRQLSRYAQAHEISAKKQRSLRIKTDEEIRKIVDSIVAEREREINAQAQIYIQNEEIRLEREYAQKAAELRDQIERAEKEKSKAEIKRIKEDARAKLAEIKAKYKEQLRQLKEEAKEKIRTAKLTGNTRYVQNVVTYTVADTKIDVRTSIPMPESLKSFLKIQFNQPLESQIKFEFDGLKTEEQKSMHVRAEVKRFFEENAESTRALTNDEIKELTKFFIHSDLLYTNKETTYKTVSICMMKYILDNTGSKNSLFNLDDTLRKSLISKYNKIKSDFAQGMAIFREAEKLDVTQVMLEKLAKKLNVDITQEDIAMLTKAVKSGDYTEMAAAQAVLYEHMTEQYKNKEVNIFEKLLKFSRSAMLSSPGTWVRNWTSNILVSKLNEKADSVGGWITRELLDKVFGFEKLKQKYKTADAAARAILAKSETGNADGLNDEQRAQLAEYQKDIKKYGAYADNMVYKDLHLVQVNNDVKSFIDKEIINSGLLGLIKDGLNKYEWAVNPHVTIENNLVRLITNSIRNKIFMNNATDNKVLQAWYGFIYKRLSDDTYIEKAFLSYLGKTLTYDNIDLSQGLSADVMNHIADAYTLAAADYMHKPNFVNDVEAYIRQKAGPVGFFVYKSIFPFLGAGVNWMVEGLKYTPAGLIWNIIRYAKFEHTVEKMFKENQEGRGTSYRFAKYLISRDIGKGVIGTIGFVAGILLAVFGIARIDSDDDEVKLTIGDLTVDISDVFGTNGITTGMAIMSAIKDKKSPTFSGVLKFTLNQMFIDSTLSNMYNTIRQTQGFGDFAMTLPTNILSNFIPNIINAVVSPTNVYRTKYESGTVGQLERILLKMVPSLAYALPKYVDPYTGKYQIQYKMPWTSNENVASSVIGTILEKGISRMTPIKVYSYNVSNNEKAALKLGVHKINLTGVYNIDDKTVKLNSSQTTALNMYYGQLNDKTLTALMNNREKYKVLNKKTNKYEELYYSQMSDSQKANVIERIMDDNAETAKIYILTTSGKYRYYASSYEKYQALKKLGISKNIYTKTDNRNGFVEIK